MRIIGYKAFIIFLALFCAYVQWSPVLALDWVIVTGHEYYVGALNPHEIDTLVVSAMPQPTNLGWCRIVESLISSTLRISRECLL